MMCYNITVFPHQDELVAVSEKSVLRVADLLDWLVTAETAGRTWTRGTRAIATQDCETGPGPGEPHPPGPGGGLDLSEIEKIRTELGKINIVQRCLQIRSNFFKCHYKSSINGFVNRKETEVKNTSND